MVDRLSDRGDRRGRRLLVQLGDEIREARLRLGISQRRAAQVAGWTQHRISEAERGRLLRASVLDLARLASVVGLDLVTRCYPADSALRDVAQIAVITELRNRVGPLWGWRLEAPVGGPGDQRAFDAVLERDGVRIAVEVVTRLRDVQAELRAARLKQRDASIGRLILVLPDTKLNRAAVESAGSILRQELPVSTREALAALVTGRDPGGDALLVLRAPARRRVSPAMR